MYHSEDLKTELRGETNFPQCPSICRNFFKRLGGWRDVINPSSSIGYLGL
jgi:hypothetical protein